MFNVIHRTALELPVAMGGESHRSLSAAVIAISQTDHIHIFRELAGHQHGEFVRLAAAVGEITHGKIAAGRHFIRKLLAELADSGMQIDRRGMLQFANLSADFFDNIRMAVADRDRDDPGEGIQILLAGLVPEVLHLAFDNHQWLGIIRNQARRKILLAKCDDFSFRGAGVRLRLLRSHRQRRALLCSRHDFHLNNCRGVDE